MRLHHLRHILWVALAALVSSGCGDKIAPGHSERDPGEKVPAAIATAERTPTTLFYEATGTVRAREGSTLAAKIMGTVVSVKVKEGDRVKAGQVLAVIDPRQVSAQFDQAAAGREEAMKGVAAAQSGRETAAAAAELARVTFERYQRLLKKEAVSRQEFDEVEARHRQAQAALSQAEAMVTAARARVHQAEAAVAAVQVTRSDAAITAPYDGIITAKRVNAGDLAAPGTPFFDILSEVRGYRADIVLPEAHTEAVSPGMEIRVTVSALGPEALPAVIETIVPLSEPGSRSFVVQAVFSEGAPFVTKLRPGMFVRARIPVGSEEALIIAESAVVRQGQLTGVFVVDDQKIARFRLVRLGERHTDSGEPMVAILSGLEAGTAFVVSPPPRLLNGHRVEAAS